MSYDIRLFKLQPGASLDAVARADEPTDTEPDPRPILKLSREEMAALADAVTACSGPWERFKGEDNWELTHDVEGSSPFQVGIYPGSAGIEIPYGRAGNAATVNAVWDILQVFRAKGFRAFDPQTDREIDLESGRSTFESSFGQSGISASRALQQAVGSKSSSSGSRWMLIGLGAGAAIIAAIALVAIRYRMNSSGK